MTHAEIVEAGVRILRLLEDYTNPPGNERSIDPVFYGYFDGLFGSMSRQLHVRVSGSKRPARIDYRFGSTNPQ